MASEDNQLARRHLPDSGLSEIISKVRAQTPARLLAGRSGGAYRTVTQLELREAHAAARDAVRTEFDLVATLGNDFIRQWNLLEVTSQASTKDEYLLRPDLGRHLTKASREQVSSGCKTGNDLQIVIGDGLSVTAVSSQVPHLLPLLREGANLRNWTIGQIFAVRHCRVGILNEIGELLKPQVVILLIGERPGLATAESLSAYMAYQPTASHTDANRNLISNIHARGVSAEQAAERILKLADSMIKTKTSGYQLREEFPTAIRPEITQ
ncbi:MAG: ethanolamine ammonia-lyase subunit EutC [Terriglobales bacterium]